MDDARVGEPIVQRAPIGANERRKKDRPGGSASTEDTPRAHQGRPDRTRSLHDVSAWAGTTLMPATIFPIVWPPAAVNADEVPAGQHGQKDDERGERQPEEFAPASRRASA